MEPEITRGGIQHRRTRVRSQPLMNGMTKRPKKHATHYMNFPTWYYHTKDKEKVNFYFYCIVEEIVMIWYL